MIRLPITKRIIKNLHKENGQAMVLILILLAIGALVTVPIVNYSDTSIIVNETHKQLTQELYAAEAGAKDAIRHLIEGTGEIPEVGGSWG